MTRACPKGHPLALLYQRPRGGAFVRLPDLYWCEKCGKEYHVLLEVVR